MKIRRVECYQIRVPILWERACCEEFGIHKLDHPRILLRLIDEDGISGWGEGIWSDAPLDAIRRLIQKEGTVNFPFTRVWAGGNSPWIEPYPETEYTPSHAIIGHRLRSSLQPPWESALYDVMGRKLGVPICALLGGPWRDKVNVHYWVNRVTPEKAAKSVKWGWEQGFRGVKMKAALFDPNVERLEAIRDTVGVDFEVNVDANGRFGCMADAWKMIKAMDSVGNLTVLEDPFPRHNLQDSRLLRSLINATLAIHIDPPESIHAVIASGAAGALNIDTYSVYNWLEQAGTAMSASIPVWHGSGVETGIGTAFQLQLVAAVRAATMPSDQMGPWVREASFLREPLKLKDGYVDVPMSGGLGIDVNEDELDRWTTHREALDIL